MDILQKLNDLRFTRKTKQILVILYKMKMTQFDRYGVNQQIGQRYLMIRVRVLSPIANTTN